MAESPEKQLERLCAVLRTDLAANPDAVADDETQQAVEQAVAVAVSQLQGLEGPAASSARSQREILAKDLWLTADLVLRAMQALDRD